MKIEEALSYERLYDSMMKCKRGVIWKDSVAHFVLNASEEVLKLESQLQSNTYKPKEPKVFQITSPKKRDISSITFRDRVVQRSLNDNILYPIMTRSFIYDNWACQKNKGTDGARNRLKQFLHKYYNKYGNVGWVLQLDIKGYYPNMSHRVVEENVLKPKLSPDIFNYVIDELHFQYKGEIGYNPGSQLVQIIGISALNKLDHFIKEQLHVKYYLRYMDDLRFIHSDKQYLEYCKQQINEWLLQHEMKLNIKKSKIKNLSKGFLFLGFSFRLLDTGKVLVLIDPEKVKEKRKQLQSMVNYSKRGGILKQSVDKSYNDWKVHASKANSFLLLSRIDQYYDQLWKL